VWVVLPLSLPAETVAAETPLMHAEQGAAGSSNLGANLPIWSVIPFIGILLSIAFIPLIGPEFWHRNFGKISLFWAMLLAIPLLVAYGSTGAYSLLHILMADYLPFIILLWGLYTTSGGILLHGTLIGTPKNNTLILITGTLLASWIGTTGAAMLLIRPLLRANHHRRYVTHSVVFFIFLVANIGGCLTPLGDPPLFLGFLHGVSFFWTTVNLLPEMLMLSLMLLCIYYFLDSHFFHKESRRMQQAMIHCSKTSVHLRGGLNLVFLGGVIGAVLMSGSIKLQGFELFGVHLEGQNVLRDIIVLMMGLLSLLFTRKKIRKENEFTWFPMVEVAKLFVGIFITIVPALAILQAGNRGVLGPLLGSVNKPWQFFWITGLLSSFLDNAPTYLTFFNTALGKIGGAGAEVPKLLGCMNCGIQSERFIALLKAISCGAVFMGANTYIGNAPNFMVKSIAEQRRVKMPSFFGYMAWSGIILMPLFVIVTLEFFVG